MINGEEDNDFALKQVNNGFWDRPADERVAAMERVTEHGEKGDFWDLSPEERGRAYE